MKLTPESLPEQGYILLDSLSHQEVIPFVKQFLKRPTLASLAYQLINFLLGVWIALWSFHSLTLETFTLLKGLGALVLGFGLAFGLAPLHEYIHAIAYKAQGAQRVSYHVNLKKLYVAAIADQFVASQAEFRRVVLAPYLVISALLAIVWFFAGELWSFTALGALTMHSLLCAGDIGLLSYLEAHKGQEVITYDDKENGLTYFYVKAK